MKCTWPDGGIHTLPPVTVRWPVHYGMDFTDRVKSVVKRLNKKFMAEPRHRPLTVSSYIAQAVKRSVERDEKILDRKER